MIDEDWLNHRYWNDGLSMRAIAAEAGCSYSQVLYWMRRHEIPRRNKSEALGGDRNPMYGKHHTPERIQRISSSSKQMWCNLDLREQHSERMSGCGNPMFGKIHREDTRQKMSDFHKERLRDPATLEKASAQLRSIHKDPKYQRMMSEFAKTRTGNKNPFFGKSHTDEAKAAIAEQNKGRFVGEKGSNWKGGITPLNHLIRNCGKYVEWRKSVFKRDQYTCQECLKVGGDLNADHVKPFSIIVSEHRIATLNDALLCNELWNIGNGRTLCASCHKNTETYGWGSFWKDKEI